MTDATDPRNFIRGGQAAIHWVRMGKQVFGWAAGLSFLAAAAYVCFRLYFWTDSYDWYLVYKFWHADSVLAITKTEAHDFVLYLPNGDRKVMSVSAFIHDPEVIAHHDYMLRLLFGFCLQALIPALLVAVGVFMVFRYVGLGLGKSDRVRGSVLVSPDQLRVVIEEKWREWRQARGKKKSDEYRYSIGGIDYPPDAPMVHTQMIGTTGSGKSVAMMQLLDQIRARGDKAVIYDRMGSFIRNFYDPETDHILNPFDARDAGWSPFADADSGPGFAAMAEAMIPSAKNVSDPFWSDAARSVFRSLAESLSQGGNANVEDLSRIILKSDLETLAGALRDTPGGAMMDLASPKTAQSVRSSVVQPLEFLSYLKHRKEAFSIGDWVREEGAGFLFLSGQVEHAAATRNLISAALEIAANATMTCGPVDRPRIWFFIDELPSLNALPCLARSLAKIRQFGGCFVLGYQVFAMLRDVYGDRVAEAIAGTVNNTVVFETPDQPTAERCSKGLGMEDITEKTEGMSIGANETRDGVTFQHRRIERPIATPSEIMDLPPLTAFLRFAYDSPRAKITLDYIQRQAIAPAFRAPTKEALEAERRRREADEASYREVSEDAAVVDGEPEDAAFEDGERPDTSGSRLSSGSPKPRTINARALLPGIHPKARDPAKRVRGEDRFLEEANAWLAALEGPPDFATGEPLRRIDDAERMALIDHFVIARLRGVAASEIGEITPDDMPTDPIAREAFNERNEQDAKLLKGFIDREAERNAALRRELENKQTARAALKARRVAEEEAASGPTLNGEAMQSPGGPARSGYGSRKRKSRPKGAPRNFERMI